MGVASLRTINARGEYDRPIPKQASVERRQTGMGHASARPGSGRAGTGPSPPGLTRRTPTRTNRALDHRVSAAGLDPRAPPSRTTVATLSTMPASVRLSDRADSTRTSGYERVHAKEHEREEPAELNRGRAAPAGGEDGSGGVKRRSAKTPDRQPDCDSARRSGRAGRAVSPTVSSPAPSATSDGQQQTRRAAPSSVLVDRVGRRHVGDGMQRAEGQGSGQRDERQQAEEDVAPADRLADRARDRRSDDARQDPGRRQRREHPRPQRFGQRPRRWRRRRSAGSCRPRAPGGTGRRRGSASMAPGRR